MQNVINWGIIGPGRIAHKFATDLQHIPDARLHAVASTSAARAGDFAARYGAKYAFGAYAELLDCPDLDVVYIATPHVLHAENAIMCLEKGIPVLCEKPMAMHAGEVRRMIETARNNHTFLMEAIWTRFLPHIHKVLELIRKGAIGELTSLQADFGFHMPFQPEHRVYNKSLGGGSLLDVGIYPVFLSLLLLGKPVKIKAMASIGPTGVDEICGMLFGYEGNQMAILDSSIIAKTPTEACIYGTKGSIRIQSRFHEPNPGFTLLCYGEEPRFYPFSTDCWGYKYEAMEVMECLRQGKKESDLLPLDFSLDLIGLLDKVREEAGIL